MAAGSAGDGRVRGGPGSGGRGLSAELPGDVAADGGGVAFEGGGAGVRVAGLQPGDGRLRGAHAGGHLGLRQSGRLALGGQLADERATLGRHATQCHLPETGQQREPGRLRRTLFIHIFKGISLTR